MSRLPCPQPCSIPSLLARSFGVFAGISSSDREVSGVSLLLAQGFNYLGCYSAAVRCPWSVHGRQGLTLQCACASPVGILETNGVACCCPHTTGIQILLVFASTGMSSASPLLVPTQARMMGHACHFNRVSIYGHASKPSGHRGMTCLRIRP